MQVQCIPVSSRSCASCIAASTSMLALRMLPPNEAWLLVFFALVLTAVFRHPALGDVGGYGAGPAHGSPVARPVHHGVRLLRAPKKAKGAVRELHAKRKLLLQGRQCVAAHDV